MSALISDHEELYIYIQIKQNCRCHITKIAALVIKDVMENQNLDERSKCPHERQKTWQNNFIILLFIIIVTLNFAVSSCNKRTHKYLKKSKSLAEMANIKIRILITLLSQL